MQSIEALGSDFDESNFPLPQNLKALRCLVILMKQLSVALKFQSLNVWCKTSIENLEYECGYSK
jgi:hypothetical protein